MKLLAALCLTGVLTATACSDDGEQGRADSRPTVQGDGGSADGIICGEAEFDIARTVTDMLIVLDRSNSMGTGTSPLWDTTRNALYSITASMDSQIWFGLFVYPGPLCTGANDLAKDCSAPTDPAVPLGPGKSGAIKTALTPMKVCGGTPIAATLMAAGQYLQTQVPASNHARYILLATDGGPDCNHSLDLSTCVVPENCLDDARTNKVLGELCAAGIKTYVVGLGAVQLEAEVLQAMAQHGCTGKPYTPTDPAAITKTFGEIAFSAYVPHNYPLETLEPGLEETAFQDPRPGSGELLLRRETGAAHQQPQRRLGLGGSLQGQQHRQGRVLRL